MVRRVVLAIVACAVLGACGGGGGDAASTATTVVAPSTVGVTTGVTPTTIADGRVPAYITKLDVAARLLTYDQIQFLTGAAAKTAWLKDYPGEPDGPPNDYYIVNVNPQLYTAPVAPDATVTLNVLADGSATDQASTLATLSDGLSKDGSEHIPFWITIKAGKVAKIEEQFVP